jgi:hypothetical protein
MMTIDVETSLIGSSIIYNYVIYSYAERDHQIFLETGVNTLEFMFQKSKKYNLFYKCTPQELQDFIKDKDFRNFYKQFTLDDLCVLGY